MTQHTDGLRIREARVSYTHPPDPGVTLHKISDPDNAAALLRSLVGDNSREHFCAIYLDARNRYIAHAIVSIGTATASLVHPREIFQPAVHIGACGIIIGHNHPSGDPQPSSEDREVVKRLSRAGAILGIRILDSLILGAHKSYYSAQESGELPSSIPAEPGDQ